MAKKNEVVKKTKTTKRAAASGEKPVVKPRQTKPAATRKPTAAPKPRTRKTASNQPQKEDKNFVVSGTVTYADGSPAEGATVIAYDMDVSGKDILGQAEVKAGRFEILYHEADFRKTKQERGGADVVVCVYDDRDDKHELLFTSKKQNNAPVEYELNIKLPAQPFVVRGTVRDANGNPARDIAVHAYDCDLRTEQLLDTATIPQKKGQPSTGNFEIPYTKAKFARAEKGSADLLVVVTDLKSKPKGKELVRSEVMFNAPAVATVNLTLPQSGKALSEIELLVKAVEPLPKGADLAISELNDNDISFIAKETGQLEEHIHLLVAAAKAALALRPSSGTVPTTHVGEPAGAALPVEFFYGCFREGMPQKPDALFERSSDELIAALKRAVARNIVPDRFAASDKALRAAIDSARIHLALRPAAEGKPASLGDVLDAVAKDWLDAPKRQQVAKVVSKVDHEADDFVSALKKAGLSDAESTGVRRALRVSALTRGHAPMVRALAEEAAGAQGDDLSGLAGISNLRWLDLAFVHDVPPGSDLTPVAYAQEMRQMVEDKAPTAVLAAKIRSKEFEVKLAGFEMIGKVLEAHPDFDIVRDDIDTFAKKADLPEEVSGALRKLQQLKSMRARWDEAPALLAARLNSPAIVAEFGREQSKRMLDGHVDEHRLEDIHQAAQTVRAIGIGIMGHLLPMLGGVSTNVTRSFLLGPEAKKIVNDTPSLRRLFGSLDTCACDPSRSVLSPAAYLADLLRFIDISGNAGWVLRQRRPGIYDSELSGDNTKIEFPHIDKVNEILENAVAFPHEIPRPAGASVDDILWDPSQKNLPDFLRKALQETDVEPLPTTLVALPDPWDAKAPTQRPGVQHWIVKGKDRSWVLKTVRGRFGAMLGPIVGAELPLATMPLQPLLDGMNQGQVPLAFKPQFDKMLIDSLKPRIPMSVTSCTIQTNKAGQSWEVRAVLAGQVKVTINTQASQAELRSANGTIQKIGLNQATAIGLLNSLKTGQVLLLQALSGDKISRVVSTPDPLTWVYELERTLTVEFQPVGLTIDGLTYQCTAGDQDLFQRPRHRNPLACALLKDKQAVFPWTLPYDEELSETRALLEKAGCSRLELLELSAADDARYGLDLVEERLGLATEQYGLIYKDKADDALWRAWGLKPDPQNGGDVSLIDTFTDKEVGGAPMKVLSRVSILLQQARLTFGELQEILQTDFVNPGGKASIAPAGVCDPSGLNIKGLGAPLFERFLDRLHRFIRLWRALGWAIWEVDLALMRGATKSERNSPERRLENESQVGDLANLGLLKVRLGLPVEMLATWLGDFGDKRYATVQDGKRIEIAPLYEHVFQDRRLQSPPDPDFEFDKVNVIANSTKLQGKLSLIGAALGLRATALDTLLDSSFDGVGRTSDLTASNLLVLYRNAGLMRATRLAPEEYLIARDMIGGQPFASPAKLLAFCDEVDFVRNSGFTFAALDYVLRQAGEKDAQRGLPLGTASTILGELQKAVRQAAGTGQEGALGHFGLTTSDLVKQPFSALPTSDVNRWSRWGLTQVASSPNWEVTDPDKPTDRKLQGTPLDLLVKLPVLAQQGCIPPAVLETALKTSYVDPRKVLQIISNVTGPKNIQGLGNEHLDRLERFLALRKITAMPVAELDALIGAFRDPASAAEPLDLDLSDLLALTAPTSTVTAAQALLTIRDRYQIPLTEFNHWWSTANAASDKDKRAALAKAMKLELPELVTLLAQSRKNPLATPQDTLAFIGTASTRKLSADVTVALLAKQFGLSDASVNALLWDGLTSSAGSSATKPAIALFISESFHDESRDITPQNVGTAAEYKILVQLQKLALLNSIWKATPNELQWLIDADAAKPHFLGITPDKLKAVTQDSSETYLAWKQSTSLFALAHSASGFSTYIDAYLGALASVLPAASPSDAQIRAARYAIIDPARRQYYFRHSGLDPESSNTNIGALCALLYSCRIYSGAFSFDTTDIDVCSKMLGLSDTSSDTNYVNPVPLARLVALLGALQKLGITVSDFKTLTSSAGADSCKVALKVLRGRLGEPGWSDAARNAMNTLREERRDRLVDYLLWRDQLRDANALYKRYLIDVEMAPCMNTTRLLQATAAAQLFIQRCLMHLEPEVRPESFNKKKLEWIQNYRIWEANRKIFLWPENWTLPELRDDRTETFNAFMSKLHQNEPSHENAVQAVREYLDDLLDVSRIEVMGMYEHAEQIDNGQRGVTPRYRKSLKRGVTLQYRKSLYMVGRTPDTPHIYYWRRALRYGEPGMRWTGWERIDLDIAGDHVLPFVWEGDFHVAWPLITTKDIAGISYYELRMAWARKAQAGWTKRKASRTSMNTLVEVLDDLDIRETFAFRIRQTGEALTFDVFAQTPIPESQGDPLGTGAIFKFGSRSNSSKVFWSLDHEVTSCYVHYKKPQEHFTKINPNLCQLIITGIVQETLDDTIFKYGRVDLLQEILDDIKGLIANFYQALSDEERLKLNLLISAMLVALSGAVTAAGVAPWAANGIMDLFYKLVALTASQYPGLANQINKYLTDPVYRVTGNSEHRLVIGSDIALPTDRMIAFDKAKNNDPPKKIEIAARYQNEIVVPLVPGIPNGVGASVSNTIEIELLFEITTDIECKKQSVPVQMQSAGRFELKSGTDAGKWQPPLFDDQTKKCLVLKPLLNSRFLGNGVEESAAGTLGFIKPAFSEYMWMIPANPFDSMSGMETWYVTESGRKLIAKIEERAFVNRLYPAGYPTATSYRELGKDSLEQLFDEPSQIGGIHPWFDEDAIDGWLGRRKIPGDPRDKENLGYDLRMPHANYNWEVFFHVPLAVADFLARQHRFDDARRWFHFIFDPTTNDPAPGRERFWRFLPFRHANQPETITQLLEALANPKAKGYLKDQVKQQVDAWLEDSFNPFAVARLRTSAFEWYTVVAYIKRALIEHGDQLYRRDTRASINEATLLYVLAAELLGRRPQKIQNRNESHLNLSYRFLSDGLDEFSNVWMSLADNPLAKEWLDYLNANSGGANTQEALDNVAQLSSIGSLYFCVPQNDKLLELWDTVEDRLFKIRHCQNIDGLTRSLPLFEAPIDPELLIRAKAAGLDIGDVLSDLYAPLPHSRFIVMAPKASELCNEVKALGSAMLSAIEKKESEHLSLLRSSQEIALLREVEKVREQQLQETDANLNALRQSRANAQARFVYIHKLLGVESVVDEATIPLVDDTPSHVSKQTPWFVGNATEGLGLIGSEFDQIGWMDWASASNLIAGGLRTAAGFAHLSDPSNKAGHSLSAFGDAAGAIAAGFSHQDRWSGMVASWQRRRDEWKHQSKMAADEMRQIDKQIVALEIRQQIAQKELDNHRKQIEHASNIDDYMRSTKFSSEALYGWMESRLAEVHFSAYQLAYDLAKRAERAFRFELGDESATFVQFGHWNSMRKGLMAGERLALDLKRMESAYLDRNRRELEITKHVSLRQLDPLALMKLRATGECEFEIPEALFDLDFPGHYFRRVKSASISVPCLVGQFASVSGTLTLLSSKLREKNVASGDYGDESNFRSSYLPMQSISTSTGQNDSGLFELNFRDERYLPFEGAGAISRWRFKLPEEFRAFDYGTISDVILHIRYTARDGGESLASKANAMVRSQLNALRQLSATEAGLVQMLSLRQEYPTEWSQLRSSVDGKTEIKLDIARFPYLVAGENVTLIRFDAMARVRKPDTKLGTFSLKLTKSGGVTAPTAELSFLDKSNLGNWRESDQGGDLENGPVTISGNAQNASQWTLELVLTGTPDAQHRALLEDIVLLVGYRINTQ